MPSIPIRKNFSSYDAHGPDCRIVSDRSRFPQIIQHAVIIGHSSKYTTDGHFLDAYWDWQAGLASI
jgi:hypothetical protein